MGHTLLSAAGFLVLGGFTAVLYGGGLVHSTYADLSLTPITIGIWIVGLIIGLLYEGIDLYSRSLTKNRTTASAPFHSAITILAVSTGAVITFWVSIELGHGPVIASALVGVVAAAVVPTFGAAVYCGSFVGMASPFLFDYSLIIVAGLVAGFVYVLAKNTLNGYGGKLGTIAWAGSITVALIFGRPLLTYPALEWDTGRFLILYCIIGAVLTYFISIHLDRGAVMASGVVGLIGGLVLPAVYGPEVGEILAVGVFCASFAGMTATSRLAHIGWMIPAGIVCAIILMYERPFLSGGGGKLGTAAFGAVIGLNGLSMIDGWFRRFILAKHGIR